MAQISSNAAKKHGSYGIPCEQTELEFSNYGSLRDILLKKILSRHLKGSYGIDDCLKNKDKFITLSKYEDFSTSYQGLKSYDAFKAISSVTAVKDFLISCGFDMGEIDILLNKEYTIGKESQEAFTRKLKCVIEKLEKRQDILEEESSAFSGAISLNRHEYEEEMSIISSGTAEKLTKCLVKLKPHNNDLLPKDHPINHLKSLEKELFSDSHSVLNETENCPKKRNCSENPFLRKKTKIFLHKPNSFWDLKERPIIASQSSSSSVKSDKISSNYVSASIKSCTVSSKDLSPQSGLTCDMNKIKDFSKPFVWNMNESQFVPLSKLQSNKVSVNDIKLSPKFTNYSPGKPSCTLYVKNLPRQIRPSTLVSIFGRLEAKNGKNIEYRLLKGKMKGQAFVKFSSIDIATEAFEICNGYIIDEKPMVIEYCRC